MNDGLDETGGEGEKEKLKVTRSNEHGALEPTRMFLTRGTQARMKEIIG